MTGAQEIFGRFSLFIRLYSWSRVNKPHNTYEIRCPVHGFVRLNDWEKNIISEPAFQRLRRIRQLAWTDQVYPGAMHTRFEHSLGVMHTATMLYEAIRSRSSELLQNELGYTVDGLKRDLQLIRLAALLHDVGHSPFRMRQKNYFPIRTTERNFSMNNTRRQSSGRNFVM